MSTANPITDKGDMTTVIGLVCAIQDHPLGLGWAGLFSPKTRGLLEKCWREKVLYQKRIRKMEGKDVYTTNSWILKQNNFSGVECLYFLYDLFFTIR